ncbi:MAG: bifunctional hydroxymethylpyrimidine kinase/phosphomethylpyrimidine kinase [Paludibacteraceae bacterium]|nr:bifunctional hydroxymethylpyrimidine kinase/phosphomethylpyrimidine kinase [Paludibacteraceae bacterium]
MKYSRVLTIAGSDSGGGAGVQADIKTISACGCYAASAITAITVQNTIGVQSVVGLPIEAIEGQMEAVLSDIGADCVKIGMLHSSEVIHCIAKALRKHKIEKVVLDTVMVSTSGHRLIEESAIETLIKELIPLATVITPNIPEAEILLGERINSQEDLIIAAQKLARKFNVSVLLKAGHLTNDLLTDYFYNNEKQRSLALTSKRLDTPNTHGTGCTLSSAIASMLAKGYEIEEAIQKAKEYLTGAIEEGANYQIGHGHGPVCHFWNLWE